jgi:cathepsin L
MQINTSPASDDWEDFKQQFQKSYPSDEEESYRKGIFDTNVEFINSENARQSEYELGVNQFSDLLVNEWSAQYFGMAKPEKPFGDDVPYLGRHQVGNETLASSVDWTTKGAVTPVKNQGQCGSCWSFSATGSMEGAYEIANRKLVSVSEQQLVDCAQAEGEQGCNGGLMDGAFKYAKKTGMCTEASYPYKAKGGTCKASSCTKAFAAGVVTGYKDVSSLFRRYGKVGSAPRPSFSAP